MNKRAMAKVVMVKLVMLKVKVVKVKVAKGESNPWETRLGNFGNASTLNAPHASQWATMAEVKRHK